jgi:hypothetical protein
LPPFESDSHAQGKNANKTTKKNKTARRREQQQRRLISATAGGRVECRVGMRVSVLRWL